MNFDILEEAPVLAYILRLDADEFVLEHVNAAARHKNPGITALYGMPMAHLYSDQPGVIADAKRCATEGVVVEHELAVRRYDRTEATQYVRLRFVPALPTHLVLYMHELERPDVTRVALSESEARYHGLVDSLPDAVLLRGADGRVLFCNDVMVKLVGATSQADLLGKHEVLARGFSVRNEAGEPVPEENLPSRRVLRTGTAERGHVYELSSPRGARWLSLAAQPIRGADGKLTGSVATLTDVTERIQAQQALKASVARLDLALSAARMGVWEYEPATDAGWWSQNLFEIFHIGDQTPGMEAFLRHVHPDDRAAVGGDAAALGRGNDGDTFEREFRLVGDDGITRWARVQGRLTCKGVQRMLGGTVMDITEQRLLEEQLHRASRLESIGRLAGGVAHDFNNLLAAMLGSLDLISGQVTGEVCEDLATIRHSALRARDLTRQLLAFARKQPVQWRTVDLSLLVREIELLLRRLVGPSVVISIRASEPVLVSADPSLLEQVLVNLVVNARDAMPSGGRLDIQVEGVEGIGGPALMTVTDSGVGMDEETRKRIFEPFFTTKAHGTGLGLASSYGIIQQHRGDISVESAPGAGTRFRVSLPQLESSADALRRSQPPLATPTARGTVLVVDDEDAVRKTTMRLVKSLGYEVLDAGNGAQAVERLRGHGRPVDMLLCDIAMPGEDGRAVAAELVQRCGALKVVFMSGYSSDMEEMRVEGALFLQKPFSRDELARKLAELPAT